MKQIKRFVRWYVEKTGENVYLNMMTPTGMIPFYEAKARAKDGGKSAKA